MWLARDKSGDLYLYVNKPIREKDSFTVDNNSLNKIFDIDQVERRFAFKVDVELMGELTFENSPKEVKLIDYNYEEILDHRQ